MFTVYSVLSVIFVDECLCYSTPPATPAFVHSALRKFGYQSFRPGQEEAIMRILSGTYVHCM